IYKEAKIAPSEMKLQVLKVAQGLPTFNLLQKSGQSLQKPKPAAKTNPIASIFGLLFMSFLAYQALQWLSSSHTATPAAASLIAPPSASQSIELRDITTTWTTTSRGFTESDGRLWVPQVRAMVKNAGSDDIRRVYCRVLFMDNEGVIKGDDVIESIDSLPASRTKGPIILTGSLGYTSDFAFLSMIENPS